jgi:hypothetical protein
MIRLLLLCALIGAAYLYLQPTTPASNQLALPTDAPAVPAPAARIESAPAAQPEAALPAPPVTTAPDPPRAPESVPRESRSVARRASPIPTSPLPPALAALESPSAGLAARRQPVTELLPDGTTRPAGGPTEPAPPLARIVPRAQPESSTDNGSRAQSAPSRAAPSAVTKPLETPATAPTPVRPSQADTFFKNAARILAETEIPK